MPELEQKPPPDALADRAIAKAARRLLPLLCLSYAIAYIDRLNISFAALQMNQDLHFSATVYGLGGGLFFLSYAAFEIPSNLLLVRFGPRRWIARIMLSWGVLAVGMMFVKTPLQFYCMRFFLGMAEAGFFPGVVYYLTLWFPADHRGRAVSRFYLAYPIGAAVMGTLSARLLDLDGLLGLAGWRWLFLAEGTPAILMSAVILICLPDAPAQARWLTREEKSALAARLEQDPAVRHSSKWQSPWRALAHRSVWPLAFGNIFLMAAAYAFTLSAPTVLKEATHWTAAQVGMLMSCSAVAGAGTMLLNGWLSDRSGERYWHTAGPMFLAAAAYIVIATTRDGRLIALAYAVTVICSTAIQAVFWLIPGDALHGRPAAVAMAAIGSIGMIGAFAGPALWGIAKDWSGNYHLGLLTVSAFEIAAAVIVISSRRAPHPAPGLVVGAAGARGSSA